jgi:hypothetical protein
MSPPVVEVRNLGADGKILGHDVHRSVVNLTQSCTNRETGDVCDMQYGFDVWLTDDKVPGLEDRNAFEMAYMTRMGLTAEASAAMARQVQQMLAPYAQQMNELKTKSGDLKGQSLRTSFHMAYGARAPPARAALAGLQAAGRLGQQTGCGGGIGQAGSVAGNGLSAASSG